MECIKLIYDYSKRTLLPVKSIVDVSIITKVQIQKIVDCFLKEDFCIINSHLIEKPVQIKTIHINFDDKRLYLNAVKPTKTNYYWVHYTHILLLISSGIFVIDEKVIITDKFAFAIKNRLVVKKPKKIDNEPIIFDEAGCTTELNLKRYQFDALKYFNQYKYFNRLRKLHHIGTLNSIYGIMGKKPEDGKMELNRLDMIDIKEMNPKNLKEAKKQILEEKNNEEVRQAKIRYSELIDEKDKLQRNINKLNEEMKEVEEELKIFNK